VSRSSWDPACARVGAGGLRPDIGDELVRVGRTVPLSAGQSADLGSVLEPAAEDHPWPDEIGVGFARP
jgi:hypothetical protein